MKINAEDILAIFAEEANIVGGRFRAPSDIEVLGAMSFGASAVSVLTRAGRELAAGADRLAECSRPHGAIETIRVQALAIAA